MRSQNHQQTLLLKMTISLLTKPDGGCISKGGRTDGGLGGGLAARKDYRTSTAKQQGMYELHINSEDGW